MYKLYLHTYIYYLITSYIELTVTFCYILKTIIIIILRNAIEIFCIFIFYIYYAQ